MKVLKKEEIEVSVAVPLKDFKLQVKEGSNKIPKVPCAKTRGVKRVQCARYEFFILTLASAYEG